MSVFVLSEAVKPVSLHYHVPECLNRDMQSQSVSSNVFNMNYGAIVLGHFKLQNCCAVTKLNAEHGRGTSSSKKYKE